MSEGVMFEQGFESRHMKIERQKLKMIDEDIALIDSVLESSDLAELTRVHKEIDGKYQSCIIGWEKGLYAYHLEHGAIYDNLDKESLVDNLTVMRPKLIAYKLGMNEVKQSESQNATDVNVTVNNNVSISITFSEAKKKIEDMPGLTQQETDSIIEKIDELEKISKENIRKNGKR